MSIQFIMRILTQMVIYSMGNERDYTIEVFDKNKQKFCPLLLRDILKDINFKTLESLYKLKSYNWDDFFSHDSYLSTKWFEYEKFLIDISSRDNFRDFLFILKHKDEDGMIGFDQSGRYVTLAKNGFIETKELKFQEVDYEWIESCLDNQSRKAGK